MKLILVVFSFIVVVTVESFSELKKKERYINPVNDEEYNVLLALATETFSKPVSKRTRAEKSAIIGGAKENLELEQVVFFCMLEKRYIFVMHLVSSVTL